MLTLYCLQKNGLNTGDSAAELAPLATFNLPRLIVAQHGGFQLVMGVPQARWLVYFMESAMKMDDDRGVPL